MHFRSMQQLHAPIAPHQLSSEQPPPADTATGEPPPVPLTDAATDELPPPLPPAAVPELLEPPLPPAPELPEVIVVEPEQASRASAAVRRRGAGRKARMGQCKHIHPR